MSRIPNTVFFLRPSLQNFKATGRASWPPERTFSNPNAGFRIRINFLRIRIRIQWIRMEANTDPDTDPDPDLIRIQGFNDQKLKKITAEKKD